MSITFRPMQDAPETPALSIPPDPAVRPDEIDRAWAYAAPPAELGYLVRPIGAANTFALIERYGGTRIELPRNVKESRVLVRLIGLPALKALVASLGPGFLLVPLAKGWRVLVLRERDKLSRSQIALRLGMMESSVSRHEQAARRVLVRKATRLRGISR